ncbi:hypothetical protein GCM10010495_18210 [Kitasatospora herbaricolor]|uniref:hypothetical protein n=1 Tax=Kitasatospora herbaricolor TaxID=68217 RepID=UPI00174DB32A|nr:hypothetical protein [Kitasatospora herbaricolor]MDQ0308269.1 hypothetical protein [Kitasatospora herbaricolor]GGV06401.1 hypothetical protein GCM10010495_18210 [Kitasatospora herbaricolor]
MDAVGVVLGLVLLIGVGLLSLAVVGTVKAAKAMAAKVERHEANARRAVENVALKAKTYTKPGAQGQISATRLALRTSLDGTRLVLESGLAEDHQLAESLQLLARLDVHAAELDGELRILEREPDTGRIAAKLPELRERAERITHSAETMRWAAQDRMHRFAEDELTRLSKECESEAGALRHWDAAPRVPGAAGSSAGGSGAAPLDGSGAGGGSGAGTHGRAGLTTGPGGPGAEELLGLGDPLSRLAQRLRKPSTGPSAG